VVEFNEGEEPLRAHAHQDNLIWKIRIENVVFNDVPHHR
jgi:hypothetical protein